MYGRIGMQSTWNSPATLAVVSASAGKEANAMAI